MELAKDILPRILQGVPGMKGIDLELIQAYWPAVVGPLMASNCSPSRLEGSRLLVEVADAGWMEEFWPMRGQVLSLLQRELPSVKVRAIHARIASSSTPGADRGQAR